MIKEEFIEIIKKIYAEFSSIQTRFEVSMENLDEIKTQINVIVPYTLAEPKILDICDKISTENDRYNITREDTILTISYNDFKINFIKSFDDIIQYKFLYNSYSIFKELLTILFENIKLKYTDIGLFYVNDGYSVLLSDDYNEIVSFLGINSKDIFKRDITYEELFNIIISTSFFDSRYFTKDIITKLSNYEENKELYNKFILYAKNQKTFTHNDFDSLYMYELDLFFSKSNLIEKLSNNVINKHKDSFIRTKPSKLKKLEDVETIPKFDINTPPPKKSKKFSFFSSAKKALKI